MKLMLVTLRLAKCDSISSELNVTVLSHVNISVLWKTVPISRQHLRQRSDRGKSILTSRSFQSIRMNMSEIDVTDEELKKEGRIME